MNMFHKYNGSLYRGTQGRFLLTTLKLNTFWAIQSTAF